MVSRHSTRFGGPLPYSPTPPEQAERPSVSHDPAYRSLRRIQRRFGVRATAAAVGGFLLYVLLSNFAPGVMNQPLAGHLTLGLALGLGQFVVMAVTAWRYVRRMRTRFDPVARGLRAQLEQRRPEHQRAAGQAGLRPQSKREFRTW